MSRTKIIFLLFSLIILAGAAFYTFGVLYLNKAHSSFDNYAAFRGCATITSRTETDGTCMTKADKNIRIVKFEDKWYLDGDLPVCAWHYKSKCVVEWP